MQRRVLIIGAILVAAGIGAPTTAIMAPGRPHSDVAPQLEQQPPRPRAQDPEFGTPPAIDPDEPVPTDTAPSLDQIPPGTISYFPVAPISPGAIHPPEPIDDPSAPPNPPVMSAAPLPNFPTEDAGVLRPPPMPSEAFEEPEPEDR